MSYTEEEKRKAIELYEQIHSFRKVQRVLGYPVKNTLRKWLKEKANNGFVHGGRAPKYTEEQARQAVEYFLKSEKSQAQVRAELGYPCHHVFRKWIRIYGPKEKLPVIRTAIVPFDHTKKAKAVAELRKREKYVQQIAREAGVSRQTVYAWDNEFPKTNCEENMQDMQKHKHRRKISDVDEALDIINNLEKQIELLITQSDHLKDDIRNLEMQKDALLQCAILLKKEKGISLKSLSNKEKFIAIDALRNKYKLKDLLTVFSISKSSFFYQEYARSKPDKYINLRAKIINVFQENQRVYGYRRIWYSIRNKGTIVSEKVVRKLMKQEGLFVYQPKMKKYSSYKGEITPEVPNIINRNFHAEAPNQKWLTDITEFALPTGKVYLSPIIDCFDGMPVSWSIGTSPNAILANTMLHDAIKTLSPTEHPIIHSDRGCHYRWPEWIQITKDAGLTRSMSKKACSPDNSACEGFFGRLKNEMFYGRSWENVSIKAFISTLDDYLYWFREKRIKVSLGGKSPMQYRKSMGYE